MKKLLAILLIISLTLSFAACKKDDENPQDTATDNTEDTTPDTPSEEEIIPPEINGVALTEFTLIYDEQGHDYNKRAAEYIKNEIKKRSGAEITIADDSTEPTAHEIVIGETSREISSELDADCEGLEFSMLVKEGSIALEGDYFIIAAAAYYFVDTCVLTSGYKATLDNGVSVHEPIVKEAKNFIILIGDGMGVNHTLLYDQLENTSDFSDGEDFFYGYLLPSHGFSRTESLSGVTDSAAGGTAIACGVKTYNDYLGMDGKLQKVQSLTELAASLGMGSAVMSTETRTGATPSSFSSHTSSRDNTNDILDCQNELILNNGTIIDCGYDYYNARYMKVIENHISDTLGKVSKNENGFFLMYEEAHIDKHSHKNNIEDTFLAVIRFNQAIARFMEFAFYNPETFILITADHETGDLLPDENGVFTYNSEDHTAYDVPIFAYGSGSELFSDKTVENIQIAHTVASFLGVTDFGDQSEYGYLK